MLVHDPVNGGIVCVTGCVLNRRRPVRERLMRSEVCIYNLATERIVCSRICGMRMVGFRSVICSICLYCTMREVRRSSRNGVISPIGGRDRTRDAYNIISNIDIIASAIFSDRSSIDSRSVNGRNLSVFCSFECRKRGIMNTDNRSSLAILDKI